jgi:DNA-directed RNA polymerase specialized sigma subunit
MHGYIFDLPKRPRKNCLDEEAEIRSMGFKYLDDITTEESNQLQSCYEHEQDNLDAPVNTESVWSYLTGCLTKQEADVIDCIFAKNMTWNETSIYLSVPQSTCWFRKNRAVEKLYNACLTLSGSNIQDNLRDLIRGNVERLFELRENVHD